MGVTVENELSIRKVVLLDLSRDAGFQSTLDRITQQVVCRRKTTGIEEYLCVRDAKLGETLEVISVHATPFPDGGTRGCLGWNNVTRRSVPWPFPYYLRWSNRSHF